MGDRIKRIAVCMHDDSLDTFFKMLNDTGRYHVLTIPPESQVGAVGLCKEAGADILLLGVSLGEGFRVDDRLELIETVREALPGCKVILYTETAMSARDTRSVKLLYSMRAVDDVVYSDCGQEYLLLKLDTIQPLRENAER